MFALVPVACEVNLLIQEYIHLLNDIEGRYIEPADVELPTY